MIIKQNQTLCSRRAEHTAATLSQKLKLESDGDAKGEGCRRQKAAADGKASPKHTDFSAFCFCPLFSSLLFCLSAFSLTFSAKQPSLMAIIRLVVVVVAVVSSVFPLLTLLIVMRAGAERMEHLRAAFSLMMMMMIWLGSFLRLLSKVFQKGSLASELSILSSTFQCARVFVVLKQCTGGGGGERLR